MKESLNRRLNAILPRITADEFLANRGIGNEIGFYIFEYDPEDELTVRRHLEVLLEELPRRRPGLRTVHINLFDLIIDHLAERKLLDRAMAMQREKGDARLLKTLEPILNAEKLAPLFVSRADPDAHDLILVSGVGSVFPILRTHTLLNNLHAHLGHTPLVMFYPGRYDGRYLRLFGKVSPSPYYRAFQLIAQG